MEVETQELIRRVGVIGDVHGESGALEAALAYLATVPHLDSLLCTGDIPAKQGDGDTAGCCRLLKATGVSTIRGNHDRWYLENLANEVGKRYDLATNAFIASLPPVRKFGTPHGPLLLCHGLRDNDMAGIYPGDDDEQAAMGLWRHELTRERVRFVVNGHTHQRMIRTLEAVTIINAGTLLWDHDPCFLVADFDALTVQFCDIAPFTYEITTGAKVALS